MAKANYTIEVKTRHVWLLRTLLHIMCLLYDMHLLPISWVHVILNYKPFINLFVYVEKTNG